MARLWTGKFLAQDKALPEPPRKWLRGLANRSDTGGGQCQSAYTRVWPLVTALALAAGAILAARAGVGLNLSGSAPRGLYRLVGGAPTRDALVVACLPPDVAAFGLARGYLGVGTCSGGAWPVLKRVGAVPGDEVVVERSGMTVNGAPIVLQPIADVDHAGWPLPHLPFGRRRVAQDELWLVGLSDSRSWDSRYFGPVPVTGVRGVARPLLTIDEGQR
jgi:conjugative transfer signal peptidase TraF